MVFSVDVLILIAVSEVLANASSSIAVMLSVIVIVVAPETLLYLRKRVPKITFSFLVYQSVF